MAGSWKQAEKMEAQEAQEAQGTVPCAISEEAQGTVPCAISEEAQGTVPCATAEDMMGKKGAGAAWLCAAAILAAGLLAGCGKTGEGGGKPIRIGVTLYDQYDTFISQLMDAFTADVYELAQQSGRTISLEVVDAAKSQSSQNEQVRSLIERGCDVVCVNLVDRTEPTVITDLAEHSDVPVIFFNRELVEEDLERWDKLYYVGADATESGILEGQIAAGVFRDVPETDKNGDGVMQYISLEGEIGHQDAIVRTEYSVDTIRKEGIAVERLGYAIANWNRAQAKTQFSALWEEFAGDIELVLANNDDMALGAVDTLKAKEVPEKDWPVIVGIDGTREGLEAVKAGELAGTVYNDKEGQARAMLDLALWIEDGGTGDGPGLVDGHYVRLPYEIVTADTMEEGKYVSGK